MTISTGAGSVVQIATALATAKAFSAITNAAEAVATFEASHGLAPGDYVLIASGWGDLDGRTVRVGAVSTNDVTLEDVDTSDTSRFPPGSGVGTGREITTWTEIAQVKADSFQTSGGEQQFADASPLASFNDRQLPTTRTPYNIGFSVMDVSVGFNAARAAGVTPTPFRISKAGVNTVGTGIWSASDIGNISGREVTTYSVSIALQAAPITYFT